MAGDDYKITESLQDQLILQMYLFLHLGKT